MTAMENPQSTMALSMLCEKASLSATSEHALSVLVSMKAPESAPAERQPLELVAVVDRSGSMSGSKMSYMKDALGFLVSHGLQKEDRFALVTFDNEVDVCLPFMAMDTSNKKTALESVQALTTGGSTNLSGGLLQGIDILRQSGGPPNSNKAILLFTDGMANRENSPDPNFKLQPALCL